jgi:hypothetical protein
MAAIMPDLEALQIKEPGWSYKFTLDANDRVDKLWWQSPAQFALAQQYSDILINDVAANRNDCQYPLNIGLVVDNFGSSRCVWYALQRREDVDSHCWALHNHLETASAPPTVFVSDRDAALLLSVPKVFPKALHLYCLHHLGGNIAHNIRSGLGAQWERFQKDFWAVYRAISPEAFREAWLQLLDKYPTAANYLDQELYPIRQHWAFAWVSLRFTAGIRTNGRVEVENQINKELGGPKVNLHQLFQRLNKRTLEQSANDMICVREVCMILGSLTMVIELTQCLV